MPDALALLETRRTVSHVQLAEPGPSDAEIRRIVTVAARVPDHGKLAPWRFVLYRGEARAALDARLAPLYAARFPDTPAAKAAIETTRFSAVPLTVGVISKPTAHFKVPEWEQVLSAGAATLNLMLAAHALGYSAQWLTGWCCYDDEAAAILGARPGERFAGLVAIGTPTVPPVDRPRPSLDDILSDWSA
ncbi:nitroreductase [Siculibacillus lacustris]|uniref:Putative NAD(P)H nitroreductase n=1 Tax=Siculibacillus lacustris TaxID=1549641 RepID=A0A4Q9VJL2_9HYPH|nr:nitroreductase [Siculibacillus lacustris]TBW34623.1 nitroreductase [Siculibacillus lacustris]